MQVLAFLAAATALHAAPLGLKPHALQKNYTFNNDESQAAEEFARFQSKLGGPAALAELKDTLKLLAATRKQEGIDFRKEELNGQVMTALRAEGSVLDPPSIVEINQPIAQYLYAGDIMLSPADMKRIRATAANENPDIRNGAPVVTSRRWPKTQPIAFVFDNEMEEERRKMIRGVIKEISSNTCLNFEENGSVGVQLEFYKGSGCNSMIGNAVSTGKQYISIGMGCGIKGTIAHEIFHTLGIDHTINRKDRDEYVEINKAALLPGREYNFEKVPDANNDNFGLPYEYGSDLHYDGWAFSVDNKQQVIIAKERDYTNTMGQRKRLTFNDYKMVNTLYACSEKCPTQLHCQNGGYTSPRDCNVCTCNDFFTGKNCETPKISIELTDTYNTTFHQAFNKPLWESGNGFNWDMFGKDAVKVIKAPEGKKIRVTINKIYAMWGDDYCKKSCPLVGVELVDNANGDLTTVGKTFCCSKEEGYSFVSKSNVIGYKAFASPGTAFDASVTYSVA